MFSPLQDTEGHHADNHGRVAARTRSHGRFRAYEPVNTVEPRANPPIKYHQYVRRRQVRQTCHADQLDPLEIMVAEPKSFSERVKYGLRLVGVMALKPSPILVARILDSWWKRWAMLLGAPCLLIWFWVALPFPRQITNDGDLDLNFYFFTWFYYGAYLAASLLFVTKLFDLFRLNWWPESVSGPQAYFVAWAGALMLSTALYHLGLLSNTSETTRSWAPETRKSLWIALAFLTCSLPAAACLLKIRRDQQARGDPTTRTALQRTFLAGVLAQSLPASYKRLLWFTVALSTALSTTLIGQAFSSNYLSGLPHSAVEGLAFVNTWIATCAILRLFSNWILERKVRSRALVFVSIYYYQLTYHVFYRSLFARLRSPTQYGLVQLSSLFIVVIYLPITMSRPFHRLLKALGLTTMSYENYADDAALAFYLRNLAANVTMVAFLGYLTILHYGKNQSLYPYFQFSTPGDPYTYKLTLIASGIIWLSELSSNFIARWICKRLFRIDVTNLGLDEVGSILVWLTSCASTLNYSAHASGLPFTFLQTCFCS